MWWKYSQRGGNILTTVEKYSLRQKYYLHRFDITTAVVILPPQWKHYHHCGNITTTVEIFSPQCKYHHCNGNITNVVEKQVRFSFSRGKIYCVTDKTR